MSELDADFYVTSVNSPVFAFVTVAPPCVHPVGPECVSVVEAYADTDIRYECGIIKQICAGNYM